MKAPLKKSSTGNLLFICSILLFSPALIYSQSVFINQAGYKSSGYKYFYTDSEELNFALCKGENGDTVYQGSLSGKIENDAATQFSD
ncbi:MAG TPA: cellulase N-terminal Ig-like domain-containing protein [Ignavibacteriaceae bacterium]|nr:cellulase N-terminal Ig-like domain-containing protein [Ignavibacteriaceae bacterium]